MRNNLHAAADGEEANGIASAAPDVKGNSMPAADGMKQRRKKKNRSPSPLGIDGKDAAGGEVPALKIQSSLTAANNGEQPAQTINVINNEEIEGLHWSDAKLAEEIDRYTEQVNCMLPDSDDDFWATYFGQELKQVNERLAMHRIRAHEISKGALLERLVDAKLEEEYPQAILEDRDYFEWYEMDFEWYFDPKYCRYIGFEDYQRLALRNETEYLHWDEYHKTYCTYKADQEFVEFYEKLSSKTKWVANAWSSASKHEWPRYERLAFYQAVKIAAGYKNIRLALVFTGFSEYIWSVDYDCSTYGAIARLYFEIWKRVAKKKMSFVSALKQVYDDGICGSCRFEMKLELDYGPKSGPLKLNYDTYVAYINARVCENEAHLRIKEAVKKFVPKLKTYYDYARKKLDIASKIGVIPLQKATC